MTQTPVFVSALRSPIDTRAREDDAGAIGSIVRRWSNKSVSEWLEAQGRKLPAREGKR